MSTVPGCNKMKLTWCFFLPNSMAQFFVSWFSAVLDALYEYLLRRGPRYRLWSSPWRDKFATPGDPGLVADLRRRPSAAAASSLAASVGPIAFTLESAEHRPMRPRARCWSPASSPA